MQALSSKSPFFLQNPFIDSAAYFSYNVKNKGGNTYGKWRTFEQEESILTLTDENGDELRFEYLDCIELEGVEYLVLMPEESNEIVILEIQPVDEENENYVAVESEEILDAVYAIFKERYKDVLEFEDW